MGKKIKIFRNPLLTASVYARNNAIPSPRSHCHPSAVTQALRTEVERKSFLLLLSLVDEKTRETNAIRQKRGGRARYYQKRARRLAQKSKLSMAVWSTGDQEKYQLRRNER